MRQYLSEAIDDYMNFRASQALGKRTLNNERGILKRMLDVNGNIYVHNLSDRHVVRHFEESAKTRSPASMSLDHTTLNQFFAWARRTKRMDLTSDPMGGRRRPKFHIKERSRIHVTQFPRLLDAAERTDRRDRMAMALLIYTLLRDQEIAGIRLSDVDLDAGYIVARITKSHTEDRMPICSELDGELRSWLTHYHAIAGELLTPHSFLLPRRRSVVTERSSQGKITSHRMRYEPHLQVARVGRIAAQALTEVGFPMTDSGGKTNREGAHTIRRSGARALFDRLSEEGYDRALRLVQQTLHHSSMEMTEKYIGINADRRTRDDLLRGRSMYGVVESDNVVRLTV